MNTTDSQNFPSVVCLQGGDQVSVPEPTNAQACPTNIEIHDGGEHTPVPYFTAEVAPGIWEVTTSEKPYSPVVAYLSSGTFLPSGTPEGNARFIARACSSHYELLSDLEVIRIIATTPHHPDALTAIREIADKRIWAATGKEPS